MRAEVSNPGAALCRSPPGSGARSGRGAHGAAGGPVPGL